MTERPSPRLADRLSYPAAERSPLALWVGLLGGIYESLLESCEARTFELAPCAKAWTEWLALPASTTSALPVPPRVAWNKVVALLECSEGARQNRSGSGLSPVFSLERLSDPFQDELTDAQVDEFLRWYRGLGQDGVEAVAIYCRLLSGARKSVHWVPVAYLPAGDERAGAIATLRVELLPGGAGRLAQHPSDWLVSRVEPDFGCSLRDAWNAALARTRETRKSHSAGSSDPDVVWQVLATNADGEPAAPLLELDGRSASGAFYFACARALAGEVVDNVLVMLDVERKDEGSVPEYDVLPVSDTGVKSKLMGLLEYNRRVEPSRKIATCVLASAQAAPNALLEVARRSVEAEGVEIRYV